MKKLNNLSLFVVALLMMAGCKKASTGQESAERAVAVKVMDVGVDAQGGGLSYSGTIEEDNATMVSFATPGTIKTLNISEGQRIGKGQYLGSLDATQAENALMAAKATVLRAQDAYDRMKRLYENKSIPEIKWVEVQSKLLEAKSSQQMAEKSLADCRLYAPASGVVSEKLAEVGQNVMAGAPVAKVVGTGVLKVRIAVPEAEVALLKRGQKASVVVDALGSRTFEAVMAEKGVEANPLSRTYDVKFRITGGHQDLLPGMVANVTLSGLNRLKSADRPMAPVVVPASVVQIDYDNKPFVWTVRNGKALKVYVTCGDYVDNGVTIESGLTPGDKVIVEGQHKVSNGTAVKAI